MIQQTINPTAQSRRPAARQGAGVAEPYRALLRGLLAATGLGAGRLRTFGLTSCHGGEGVTTVAAQLALAAASSSDLQVLLVDANVGRPALHRVFHADREPGLADALSDSARPEAAVQASPEANLALLTAGRAQAGSAWLYDRLGSPEAIQALSAGFDLVIFDLPAVGQDSSALSIAGFLDGIVLVVEAERVRWLVAQRAKEMLHRAGANVLGAVLNKRQSYIPNWLYRTL